MACPDRADDVLRTEVLEAFVRSAAELLAALVGAAAQVATAVAEGIEQAHDDHRPEEPAP